MLKAQKSLCSAVFLFFLVSCSSQQIVAQKSVAPSKTVESAEPKHETAAIKPDQSEIDSDTFAEAMSRGTSASTIAQTSHSKDDWNLVAQKWSEAIALLKEVPKDSHSYSIAQKKLVEYQKNLAYAQGQPTFSVLTKNQPVVQSGQPVVQPEPQTTAIVQPVVQPKPQTIAIVQPVQTNYEQESAKRFLEEVYFNTVINEGTDGDEQWCSDSKSLQESLFSPRSYKILSVKKYGTANSPSYRFHTTVESSNGGGIPIINNWSFYVMREKNKSKAKNLSNGWCLGFIAH